MDISKEMLNTGELEDAEKDDLNEISDNPKNVAIISPDAIEIDGHIVTRKKLEQMEDAAKRVKISAYILDTCGLEAIVSIVTGAGDIGGTLLSLHPVMEAIALKCPKPLIEKMLWNLAKDFFIGLIPLVGDVADFFYKANKKNRKLFEAHLEEVRQRFADHPEKITEAQMEGSVSLSRAQTELLLEAHEEV